MSIALQQISTDESLISDIKYEIHQVFVDLLSSIDSEKSDAESFNDAVSLCADRVEILAMTFSQLEFVGLMDSCQLFKQSVRSWFSSKHQDSDDILLMMFDWPCLVISYLDYPGDIQNIEALSDYHADSIWGESALNDDEKSYLHTLLETQEISDCVRFPQTNYLSPDVESSIESFPENILDVEDDSGSSHFESVDSSAENGLPELLDVDEADILMPDEYLELVSLVTMEIEASIDNLTDLLNVSVSPDSGVSTKDESLKTYSAELMRFSSAAESVGLVGIKLIFAFISNYITSKLGSDDWGDRNEVLYLSQWPALVSGYLQDVGKHSTTVPLIQYLTQSPFSQGMAKESFDELQEALKNPNIITDDEDREPRQTEAKSEDVSLHLPEDVNQQLLDTLLQELPGQIAEFSEIISRIVGGDANLNDVAVANRIAHTLKGSANTVGVVGVATLTHHIEDILEAFAKNNHIPGKNLASILLNASDVLEMMSENLLGIGPEPEHAREVLQSILDWANRIDQEGLPSDDEALMEAVATTGDENPAEEQDSTPSESTETINAASVSTPMLRVPASVIDELLRLVGESTILNGQLQERLRQAKFHTESVHEQNLLFQELTYELEQLVDIQGLSTNKSSVIHDTVSEFRKDGKFDALEFDQYNELHTVTHRLVEAATDAKEMTQGIEDQLFALDGLMVDQGRLHRENQEVVMRTRMVPVKNIVPRLHRSVRQTCRQTGKDADLIIYGEDTLIDSDVLNDLVDPLMHIIRNSIDHGIEDQSIRIGKQKPSNGKINLSFKREGENIVVRCEDDGTGLDIPTIKEQAIKVGLIKSGSSETDDEIARLILVPGFTTKNMTTQVSGRGIGMDVVYTRIKDMKGSLDVSNSRESGCIVEFRLPLTLISIHALLVNSQNQNLAISSRGVEQIIYPGAGTIAPDGKEYLLNGKSHVLSDMESLIGVPSNVASLEDSERTILLVRTEANKLQSVSVEDVKSTQDLVLKQLGEYVPVALGVAGATILGDGSVAPVLDLPELIRASDLNDVPVLAKGHHVINSASSLPVAMVVDDSLSARRSLAEFIADSGYEVITARDGLEAIELIEQKRPDIILADLEMPRMNGLELTSHVRASQDTKNLPVIMITSRSTDKHRQQASVAGVNVYLTKPFSENELIEHVEKELNRLNKEQL